MKTITITLHNDEDAAYLLNKIETATNFKDQVEVFEMDEETSDEELEAFDERMEEFYAQPFDEATYTEFREELKERFGISFFIMNPQ